MVNWDTPADRNDFSWDRLASITPHGYVCYYTSEPPQIDGRLDDPAWADAPWTERFVDIEGDRKPRPPFDTHVAMRWDADYFYIAARLEEPHVWASLTEKNSVLFQDNDFEVFIDPDGDNHLYYELEINALNTIWELTMVRPYRDGGPAESPTNIEGLRTAVHIDGSLNDPRDRDLGWSIEIAIPWKGMARYGPAALPPRHGDQWRVNFSRVEWELEVVGDTYRKIPDIPENNWVWSPQGAIDMHRPERYGFVQFSTERPGHDAFRPDPTLPTRDLLMSVYYAQRNFQRSYRRWASSVDELLESGSEHAIPEAGAPNVIIESLGDGFRATARVDVDGRERVLSIDHESRIVVV